MMLNALDWKLILVAGTEWTSCPSMLHRDFQESIEHYFHFTDTSVALNFNGKSGLEFAMTQCVVSRQMLRDKQDASATYWLLTCATKSRSTSRYPSRRVPTTSTVLWPLKAPGSRQQRGNRIAAVTATQNSVYSNMWPPGNNGHLRQWRLRFTTNVPGTGTTDPEIWCWLLARLLCKSGARFWRRL